MSHDTPAPRRRLTDIIDGGADSLRDQWDSTEAASEFRPLPTGTYTARVLSGELFTAKKGTPGLNRGRIQPSTSRCRSISTSVMSCLARLQLCPSTYLGSARRMIDDVVLRSAGDTPPDARADERSTDEDAEIVIAVLLNDDDLDGDVLIVQSVDTTGTIGAVTINSDNTITFDPDKQFESLAVGESATEAFTYTVEDESGNTASATVRVTITGVNDAPVANEDAVTTDERTAVVIDVLDNDQDVDTGDTLVITSIDDTGTIGNVSLNDDGTITYSPPFPIPAGSLGGSVAGQGQVTDQLIGEMPSSKTLTPALSLGGRGGRSASASLAQTKNRLISIPENIPGTIGQTVDVPVLIDDATDVRAITFDVFYDAAKLHLTGEDVFLGNLWSGDDGWAVVANVVEPGRVRVVLYSPRASATGAGEIATLRFTIDAEAPAGHTELDIEHASPVGREGGFTFGDDDGSIAITLRTRVVGRHIFYNNSSFDGNDPDPNEADDNAIAIDKEALLPGQTATFTNYTSYSLGINGIMIDVEDLVGVPDVDDFEFRVGNNDDPTTWNLAPAPAPGGITVREGSGIDGSHRITIIWDDASRDPLIDTFSYTISDNHDATDTATVTVTVTATNAIETQWLQVTMLPITNTGLPAADVFYFGNAIGESGNSDSNAIVDAADELNAQSNPHSERNPALIDDPVDYNRDSLVNATDELIANANMTNLITALKLITVPATASATGTNSLKPLPLEWKGASLNIMPWRDAWHNADPAPFSWLTKDELLDSVRIHLFGKSNNEPFGQFGLG